MQIARPASGFRIVEKTIALQTLQERQDDCPWLPRAYDDLKERLRMAGHKTGYSIKGNETRRYYVEADPRTSANRMTLRYDVLGDTLTILSLKVLI